uniref:E3 ubiquitin-protein ligase CHFR n=1 Tax=Tetraodon nigroviridis TaxID=99883 RepID=H3DH70_TETNG
QEMEGSRKERPWGKLVKVDSSETVLLFSRECTVGRKKGCYLSFPTNKLVSGEHCKIVQDASSGLVWLEDMSTNGTVINMSKLVKKQTHLQNGDVIYFVYRKSEPEQNIAYVYHSIRSEQPLCQDGYVVASMWSACLLAHAAASVCTEDRQRSDLSLASASPSERLLSVEPVMLTKTPRDISQEDPQPSTSRSRFCIGSSAEPGPRFPVKVSDAAAAQEKDDTEPESKRRKTANGSSSDSPHTSAEGAPVKTAVRNNVDGTKTDKMEESLTCVICQDLLHDCISLQPCMHVFCAACYSGWMERSSLCPTCRCPVERIRKNHILNNLVEAYLLQHPEKCRSEEDLKSMESRNKITQDMLQPKVERSFSDEEGSSDYLFEFSDNDSDSSDMSQPVMVCRQCPDYKADIASALLPSPPKAAATEGGAKAAGEQPSTSSDVPSGDAPQEYRCPPRGFHVFCTCCLQPMPDRRAELGSQQVAQQCGLCQRSFCHMYWGCRRIGCRGCLAPFSELNFTDKCLDGVLNNNSYESEVLQNYLSSRGKSWKDLRQEALQSIEQGKYDLTDRRISRSTIMCIYCGLRALADLAYKYRQSIPPSELPAAVTARPDCYWGRNCRTQVKAHHAMKFNHICEQTRFKS